MMDGLTRVAIVIPVFNRRDITLQCLQSLRRIDRSGLDVRIFIVDDGSTDGTSEAIAQRFPDVTIIPGDGTLHYAAGTNMGIAAGLGWGPDFIVTMNDDSVFHQQFLQRLLETSRANPRSIVGGLLLLWNEPHRAFQVDFRWNTWKGGWQSPEDLTAFNVPRNAFEVEGLAGNCLLIPVEAVRECGMLDAKRFPHGWGDMQYTRRLRAAGWKLLIEPRAYIWCEPNTYPKPLHRENWRRVLEILFRDRAHPLNLHRQFVARWFSAPSAPEALAAYTVYLLTLAGKALAFGSRRSAAS
ncbi:MAG TPA: glycosyltransferase family 2 protein, partial [Pyrinomonadaceae bacterium]|nr:glycosyltransferase family 2 protein [Pyrinomonadaceae bacterium]